MNDKRFKARAKWYYKKRMFPYRIEICGIIMVLLIFTYLSDYTSIHPAVFAGLVILGIISLAVYSFTAEVIIKPEIDIMIRGINKVRDSKDAYAELVKHFLSSNDSFDKYLIDKISEQALDDNNDIDKDLLQLALFRIETKYRGAKGNDRSE